MEKTVSIDGLDFLMDNFFEDEICLDKLFNYIYFVDIDLVNEHASKILEDIKTSTPIPVRYSQKAGAYFKKNEIRKSSPKLKNRKDACEIINNGKYFSSVNERSHIVVKIDADGNKSIKDFISNKLGHSFVKGKSTIINCMISHIWGNTNDPLFFSLLWNVVITPLPLSFILDKEEENLYNIIDNERNKKFIRYFKDIIKAISIQLYNPNELMQTELVEMPSKEIMREAGDLIDRNKIKFLPNNNTNTN